MRRTQNVSTSFSNTWYLREAERADNLRSRTHPRARSGTGARALLCKCTGRKATRTRAHAPSHLSVEHLSSEMCESATTGTWRAKVAQLAYTRQAGERHRCAPLGSLWTRKEEESWKVSFGGFEGEGGPI